MAPLVSHTLRSGYVASAVSAGGLMLHPIASPYPELFATYDELGSLLAQWDRGECPLSSNEFEEACADLVDRLILLGKAVDQYSDQRWALAFARITAVADGS